MTREELLNSEEYWLVDIQTNVYNLLSDYMRKTGFNRNKLGEHLGFTKGYISQIMNGDFDYKTSKLVELSLACNKVPLLFFVDKDQYLKDDANDKVYELMPMKRGKWMTFEPTNAPYEMKINSEITASPIELNPEKSTFSGGFITNIF